MSTEESKKSKAAPRVVMPSLRELSGELGVSTRWIRRKVKAGEFPLPRRMGCFTRFYRPDVDAYLAALPRVVDLGPREEPARKAGADLPAEDEDDE